MTVLLTTQVDQHFTRAKSGTIWGTVYFELDEGQFFPNQDWTDLTVACVRNWLEMTLTLAEGTVSSNDIPFYDGPVRIEATATDSGMVDLRFLHRDVVKYTAKANSRDLLDNALMVGRQLMANCAERNWSNRDTDSLAMWIDRATQYVERNRRAQ